MNEANLISVVCDLIQFDKERTTKNELPRIEVESFALSDFWTQFEQSVQALHNEVTKISFMCGSKPYPKTDEVSNMLQNLVQCYNMMRELYQVLPHNVGKTVFTSVTTAVEHIMSALLDFVCSLGDISEGGSKQRLILTEIFGNACNAVDFLSQTSQATECENEAALENKAQEELIAVKIDVVRTTDASSGISKSIDSVIGKDELAQSENTTNDSENQTKQPQTQIFREDETFSQITKQVEIDVVRTTGASSGISKSIDSVIDKDELAQSEDSTNDIAIQTKHPQTQIFKEDETFSQITKKVALNDVGQDVQNNSLKVRSETCLSTLVKIVKPNGDNCQKNKSTKNISDAATISVIKDNEPVTTMDIAESIDNSSKNIQKDSEISNIPLHKVINEIESKPIILTTIDHNNLKKWIKNYRKKRNSTNYSDTLQNEIDRIKSMLYKFEINISDPKFKTCTNVQRQLKCKDLMISKLKELLAMKKILDTKSKRMKLLINSAPLSNKVENSVATSCESLVKDEINKSKGFIVDQTSLPTGMGIQQDPPFFVNKLEPRNMKQVINITPFSKKVATNSESTVNLEIQKNPHSCMNKQIIPSSKMSVRDYVIVNEWVKSQTSQNKSSTLETLLDEIDCIKRSLEYNEDDYQQKTKKKPNSGKRKKLDKLLLIKEIIEVNTSHCFDADSELVENKSLCLPIELTFPQEENKLTSYSSNSHMNWRRQNGYFNPKLDTYYNHRMDLDKIKLNASQVSYYDIPPQKCSRFEARSISGADTSYLYNDHSLNYKNTVPIHHKSPCIMTVPESYPDKEQNLQKIHMVLLTSNNRSNFNELYQQHLEISDIFQNITKQNPTLNSELWTVYSEWRDEFYRFHALIGMDEKSLKALEAQDFKAHVNHFYYAQFEQPPNKINNTTSIFSTNFSVKGSSVPVHNSNSSLFSNAPNVPFSPPVMPLTVYEFSQTHLFSTTHRVAQPNCSLPCNNEQIIYSRVSEAKATNTQNSLSLTGNVANFRSHYQSSNLPPTFLPTRSVERLSDMMQK